DPFGGSHATGISADGRYVVFGSDAPNLARHDTNHAQDIFVRDRIAGTTRRVSTPPQVRRPTPARMSRRSPPTGAMWPSPRPPPTWHAATPTASRTSSSATAPPGRHGG